MRQPMSNVDQVEIKKFANLKDHWWDPSGKLKTLHDINPARLDFIKRNVTLDGKRLLDVGCGGGILAESLAINKAIVTGIDLEASAIDAAMRHAKENNVELNYHVANIETFTEDNFEIVTCYELLEHVPNPESFVLALSKKLNKGGKLFLSTINRTVKAYFYTIIGAEYLLRLLPRQTHDYQKFIRPSELAKMLRQAHLTVKCIKGLDYNPFTRKATLTNDVDVNYLVMCEKD